jgi:hypothetical protein
VKLLFDNNLSARLSAALADLYPDSVHVRAVELQRAPDDRVWDYAREHGYLVDPAIALLPGSLEPVAEECTWLCALEVLYPGRIASSPLSWPMAVGECGAMAVAARLGGTEA